MLRAQSVTSSGRAIAIWLTALPSSPPGKSLLPLPSTAQPNRKQRCSLCKAHPAAPGLSLLGSSLFHCIQMTQTNLGSLISCAGVQCCDRITHLQCNGLFLLQSKMLLTLKTCHWLWTIYLMHIPLSAFRNVCFPMVSSSFPLGGAVNEALWAVLPWHELALVPAVLSCRWSFQTPAAQ